MYHFESRTQEDAPYQCGLCPSQSDQAILAPVLAQIKLKLPGVKKAKHRKKSSGGLDVGKILDNIGEGVRFVSPIRSKGYRQKQANRLG
jgi:hypothetical protein